MPSLFSAVEVKLLVAAAMTSGRRRGAATSNQRQTITAHSTVFMQYLRAVYAIVTSSIASMARLVADGEKEREIQKQRDAGSRCMELRAYEHIAQKGLCLFK